MKKKIIISVFTVAALALAVSPVLANYGDDNSVVGYVKEKGVLKPIAKAKVKIYKKGKSKVQESDTTDSKGKYKLSDLEEGDYKVKVKADGYRNPKNMSKDTVSKSVDVDGKERQNLYMAKQ